MISIFQRFSALTVTLILLVIATVFFSINLALRSNIHDNVHVESKDLGDSCLIYRNAFGIPHIIAHNEQDLYFSLGFVHAQDRLWQMDLMRRIACGRTARIFGEKTLAADKFFRVLGIPSIAKRLASSISRQSKTALDSYSKGVNAFIEQNLNNLPFEFDALHYAPEPWKAADCLAIERLMAFDMSMSFWTDLAIGEIADTLGVSEALRFIPSYPEASPTVCDYSRAGVPKVLNASSAQLRRLPSASSELVRTFTQAMQSVRMQVELTGMCSGSNCWIMTKQEGKAKGTIFANDPHVTLALPPRWYQVHLTCPQFNAVGCSIPGIPGIISGRNDHIAWGITNVMLDDCDYFIEKIDPANDAYYIASDGSRAKFKRIRDTIEVKRNSRVDSLIIDFRATSKSNIISDVHLSRERDSLLQYPATSKSLASKYALSFSWTGREESDEVLTALRLLRCASWKDFCETVSTWGAPALNFTFADESGNMGVAPSGLVPMRGEGDANFPHPGWETKYAWKGFHSASSLPRIFNPQRRFVFSANNLTTHSAAYFLSSLWEPASRAERIEEMLDEYHEYTVRDAQFMQLDLISRNAKSLLRATMPIVIRDSINLSPAEYQALSTVLHWDYSMTALDVAPSIYTVFQERFMHNVFTQKISPELYKKYSFVGSLPMRKLNEIVLDTSFSWFGSDPVSSQRAYHAIVVRSFKDAISFLTEKYGADQQQWTYGRLHTLTLKHPFHERIEFRSIVSHEVKNIGGDATTLNNALWQVHKPFDVFVGASMRLVTDMEDSVVYTVVPGGSSGQPLDAHYSDQIQLWSNGGYIPLSMSTKPSTGFTLFATLSPIRKK